VFLRERFCCHYYREGPLLREQSTGHLSAPIVFVEAAMVHELFSALVTVRASATAPCQSRTQTRELPHSAQIAAPLRLSKK
jgi:hypothetical protein